jgi:hypothetical protein
MAGRYNGSLGCPTPALADSGSAIPAAAAEPNRRDA